MASVREVNNNILRKVEYVDRKVDDIHKLVKAQKERLDKIQPQQYLPAIPRPKQGVSIGRTSSITTYLRQEIKRLNASKAHGEPRYIEVPDNVDDKQMNTDALNCLEIILMFHLDFHYGRMSWEKVTKAMPRVAATIYREARMTPELAVFSQTAALWAIDLLLAAKMKSRMRSVSAEKGEREEITPNTTLRGQEAQSVNVFPKLTEDQQAVSAVPDLTEDQPAASIHPGLTEDQLSCRREGQEDTTPKDVVRNQDGAASVVPDLPQGQRTTGRNIPVADEGAKTQHTRGAKAVSSKSHSRIDARNVTRNSARRRRNGGIQRRATRRRTGSS